MDMFALILFANFNTVILNDVERICNGRMCTDRAIGAYTYIARNGSSTIDYLLTIASYFMNVVSFDV